MKVDETGTPTNSTAEPTTAIGDLQKAASDAADKFTQAGNGIIDGWTDLFITPPIATCEAIPLPKILDALPAPPDLNPCPVVDNVRAVMAYIWALTAIPFCLGMIKRVM